VNYKWKSRRWFFLLMWSRTPPISSEFRGGGGVWTPQTPPLGTPLSWGTAKFCSGTSCNYGWISNQVPPNCWEHASFLRNKASFPWAVLSSAAVSLLLSQPRRPAFPRGWQRWFCAALLGGDRWWRERQQRTAVPLVEKERNSQVMYFNA